ncbi:MAG: UDP-N-acetylmuramate--L-alanine ligase [Candidatus Levybacteria bacterium RIFCSPLOWO2_02_FULL_37_10]|nr:MAG: UDP-N-acetylmuramate--L-alanine ligase [Candidatus Levybacteria bacterium RIFCSPHIGHO2_01_FULL_37_33]OGH17081.1 MAG: UDP-N-acetylmuramate--L-alanine ligase [Candidatus Levybacteria bacterium RIFCSPHIGHO2_02_FULL_37_11]OGH30103.1 MAG: UDP-N-acetylmuramate--L-alanine ligase [Candidatus Levybacteria bacterium RIFCSPHIGHO2_12_FULL_37_12]OGH33244.1 MAG: UDP-N-acetylmuramate--L-alanine ligase [Candidatus Levybacteria bacterium RIFCSPLOWO2_01_FULL_36_54]OGH43283.1 MAG: UDP-N-acetylmuramate--L-
MRKIKSIHFVGLKGVGMTPLAIIAKEAGMKVTGSDIKEEFITDISLKNAGIAPFIGFSKENVKDADLVIATGAHGGLKNIEVLEAKKRGIPVWTQGQAVGEYMRGNLFKREFIGISVAGSHGKTTTTAMIATILAENNLDASFLIGTGSVPSLGAPGHFGKGKYFVAEADEYATEPESDLTPKFLWQNPKIEVFTNIEFDHPDIYKSVDEIREDFLRFANKIPKDGILIAGGDDKQIKELLKDYSGAKVTFGFSPVNDYVLEKVRYEDEKMFFWISAKGTSLGEFPLNAIGGFNISNALASIIAGVEVGLSLQNIKKAIGKYNGSKRRFEFIGRLKTGAKVFDDYAHHPTEIKKTLAAIRKNNSKSKIVCIFQPHTYSRTKALFSDFVTSFYDADTVILMAIYPSLREEKDSTVSSELLAQKISQTHRDVLFLPDESSVVEYIDKKKYGDNTIIITMGAGDVYKISEKLDFR